MRRMTAALRARLSATRPGPAAGGRGTRYQIARQRGAKDPGAADDRGDMTAGDAGMAMMLVILVMLVVTGLCLVVTAAVIQRIKPTQLLAKNAQTLSAADTGLEAALSQIRSAAAIPDVAGNVFGAPSSLPCAITGAVTDDTSVQMAGQVAGSSSALPAAAAESQASPSYSVSIAYFTTDPTGQDAAWRTAHQLPCTPGSGVTGAPRYALLTSRGSGAAIPGFSARDIGDRVLEATYAFKVTNANISGGLMWTFGQGFCIQANSASAGATLSYAGASGCSRSQPLQLFQWDSDYRIRLSATTAPGATPLCITGVFTGSADATLQTCSTTRFDQLFGYEGGARFRGQNQTNTDTSSNCLWSGSYTAADLEGLVMKSGDGCSSYNDAHGSWAPEARFGAGAASYDTHQIVNYQQFGRCFDITGEDINAGYEILYPCKQDPSGRGGFLWNHKIYYVRTITARQPITVINRDGVTYCLTTPPAATAPPVRPRMTPCVPGQVDQQWVRTEAVAGSYAASYTFTDTYGRCLGIGPQEVQSSGKMTPWSTIAVSSCDGGASQKWNAPAEIIQAGVSGLREDVHRP